MANVGTENPSTGSVTLSGATTPAVTNLAVGLTETSHVLATNLKQLMIRCRGIARLQIAFTATESTTKYMTVPSGTTLYLDQLDFTSKTLYLTCSKAAQVAEIMELS